MSNVYDQLGFVTLDEIQNVFTDRLAKVEQELFRGVPSLERRSDQAYIMTWLDNIRQELMKRARSGAQDYLTKNPKLKQQERQEKAQEAADKSRQSYEDRVRLGRQNFSRTYGNGG